MNRPLFNGPVLEETFPLFTTQYLIQFFWAGFVATFAMSFLVYAGALVRFYNLDFAGMLGGLLSNSTPLIFSGSWWAGMAGHFVNGTVIFPMFYAILYQDRTGESGWVRGATWGFLLWLSTEVLILPLLGGGFFASRLSHPYWVGFNSLLVTLLYGVVFGELSRQRKIERIEIREVWAA